MGYALVEDQGESFFYKFSREYDDPQHYKDSKCPLMPFYSVV